jgi:hypothetical protein
LPPQRPFFAGHAKRLADFRTPSRWNQHLICKVPPVMSRVPDEGRSWMPEELPEAERTPLDRLREELRRRSELAKLYRSLSRDYPGQG